MRNAEVHNRLLTLERSLRAAGIDPDHWPWRSDTTEGLQRHAELTAKSKELGDLWWIAWLEETWAKQRSQQKRVVAGGRPKKDRSASELEKAYWNLKQKIEGEPTFEQIGKDLDCSGTTVRRRIAELKLHWPPLVPPPPF